MKAKYKVFCLVVSIFATSSCETKTHDDDNSEKENNSLTVNETNVNEISEETLIISNYSYDTDWEIIKESILNNDLKTLNKYSLQNNVDVEEVLIIAKDEFIVNALKKTSYTDLEPVEMEDGVYLVFIAVSKYEDENGEFYESSFSIYFEQGDQNLMLAFYLIAG